MAPDTEKEITIDVILNGVTFVLTVGYDPPQKVDSERPYVTDVPGGFYLIRAYNRDMAEDVPEGSIFDSLERIVWDRAKRGFFDKQPQEREVGK